MSSRNLVICDREERYAAAFASFLMKKTELAFQVQVCSRLAQVEAIRKENPIDILLVGSSYPQEEWRRIQAGHVFILTESGKKTESSDGDTVYRYQSAEAILSEIICKYSEKEENEELFFRTVKSGDMRIIGIFSPMHRSGKTSYGLELGQLMAASNNALYLNMEIYGGIGGHFPEGGHTLEDALYYSRQESKNLGMILTTLVGHMGQLDYLLPVRVSEDIKSVELADWLDMIHQIAEQSIYDVLILDIDEGLRDVYGLLRICTEIHVPVAEDASAKAKLLQFEEELHLLGYDDVRRKMVKKELKI